jgi:hypothetical protein
MGRGRDQHRGEDATHPLKSQGFLGISDRATTGDVSSGVWLVTPVVSLLSSPDRQHRWFEFEAGFELLQRNILVKEWLDENCHDRVLKKAALEQSASDAASGCSFRGSGPGDLRTKPISIVGTERQQTVHSHLTAVLALREHLRVTNRPPTLPSRCGAHIDRRGFGAKPCNRTAPS